MQHRTRLFACLLIIGSFMPVAVALADEVDLQTAMEQDVLLRAMVDELNRQMTGLSWEDMEKPYFIALNVSDSVFCRRPGGTRCRDRRNAVLSRSQSANGRSCRLV